MAAQMIIALLVLIGVNLALILLLVGVLLLRRHSVKSRRGVFKGKLRVVEGEVEGVSENWTSGYGYWVHDVLVWARGPSLLRTTLIPVDGTDAAGIHCGAGEVSRLGKSPIVAPLLSDDRSRLELASAAEDRDLALGPFALTSSVGSLVRARVPAS
jgi:hypothetical protein